MANAAAIDFTIALQALDIPDVVVLKITEAHKIGTARDLANVNWKPLGTFCVQDFPHLAQVALFVVQRLISFVSKHWRIG